MQLSTQKRIASGILNCSKFKVKFDEERLSDIKEAITKHDIKGLIAEGAISKKGINQSSKGRTRKNKIQKRKGQQKGRGSRKGKENARQPRKNLWMDKIRLQRNLLKELREKKLITAKVFREIYLKAKGGFFRSKRHIKLYLGEHNLIKKENTGKDKK